MQAPIWGNNILAHCCPSGRTACGRNQVDVCRKRSFVVLFTWGIKAGIKAHGLVDKSAKDSLMERCVVV
jgi:hypothetical protein